MKNKIEFKEFLEIETKLEIKIGKIIIVDKIPKSDKLLKLTVDFGEIDFDNLPIFQTVVTNIGDKLNGDFTELININLPFITNLKPTKIMGVESTAMIMVGIKSDGSIDLNLMKGSKLI